VFLEQDYLRSALREKLGAPDPPKTMEGETAARALFRARWLEDETDLAENRRILAALLRSDIEVRGDYNPAFFHQKFVLRDYRGGRALPTSALLSGSANFTVTDTHRNLNNVFVFRNAYICRQYETEVAQLRRGSFGRGLQGDEPRTYSLAGVPVKVLFAPDHTPELELMKQMLKVKAADPDTGLAEARSRLPSSPSPAHQESTTPCSRSLAAASRSRGCSTAGRPCRDGRHPSGFGTSESSCACRPRTT
jgi:PLD-like domain